MIYFNGFSLEGEETFFSPYLLETELCVAGFSYGAQKAFDYVYENKARVERLLLFSPAFFQDKKASFIRTQLRYFDTDEHAYIEQFCKNAAYPSRADLAAYLKVGSKAELEALLTYTWEKEKIESVLGRGTKIEVFLGEEDRIIDAQKACEFFSSVTSTYTIKHTGHLLNRKDIG